MMPLPESVSLATKSLPGPNSSSPTYLQAIPAGTLSLAQSGSVILAPMTTSKMRTASGVATDSALMLTSLGTSKSMT